MAALRVAYAGHDFLSSCLDSLIKRPDVHIVLCLTSHRTHTVNNVLELADNAKVPVFFGRPDDKLIAMFNELRIDLLVSAAYLYRIPVERLSVKYAVNIHPSLLPAGRGPNPLPYLVNGERAHCGISIHETTPEFDKGPVLLQERIQLAESDGSDELFLKLFATAPRLLDRCLDDLAGHFQQKREQESGSYWPEHTEQERLLMSDRAQVDEAIALHSKFGAFGTVIELLDGERITARHMVATKCTHRYDAGTVVAKLARGWIVALSDGLMQVDAPY
jgi:methionyl-tRNA formyltransferase